MRIEDVAPRIDYLAPQHVRDAVLSLERTEDVRFSPSNRRLAVAGFLKNKITVFEVSIAASQNSKSIVLTDVAEFSSACLSAPHGLDFIDDDKILVANRDGEACIFELPQNAAGSFELAPLAIIHSDNIDSPGSVAVIRNERGLNEALICNNYTHRITRHSLDLGHATNGSEVLLNKWLEVPDGISVSKQGEWIAVSSHRTHAVLLYENASSLNEVSGPIGILRGNSYPHGLRFTSDGRFILVADAAAPYVNIYERGGSDWRGLHDPLLSLRVLDNEEFMRGHHNVEEGGPKGIDVNETLNVMVSTCECQPLAFFDLEAILKSACAGSKLLKKQAPSSPGPKIWLRNLKALQVSYELNLSRIKSVVLRSVRTLTDRNILQGISHPSSFRIVRYLFIYFARRAVGVTSFGDRLRSSAEKQMVLPIPKEVPPEPFNSEEISRVIFQTWKSRVEISLNYRYWRSTFIKNNPEFQCVLWDDDDNREFVADKFAWFLPVYDRLPTATFRADAVRPLFLFLYGGVYVDLDTECLRPLSTMPHSGDVILGQMGPDLNFANSIPNAIMASKPFQLFWLLVLALMIEKLESLGTAEDIRRAGSEVITGPGLLHEAFDYYRLESEQNVRIRTRTIIENLPENVSAQVKAGRIELLPPDIWYPIISSDPFHSLFRRFILRHGILLAPAEARSLFPQANLLTYWTHSWWNVS
jgi:hypothetical protein